MGLPTLVWAVVLVIVMGPEVAQAIPTFARRYETSCQTCHVAYPKLTPFGEAFRRNGYRFPGGGDALAEKQPPVSLGAEAQRDRFPAVVLPGELPGAVPLSLAFDAQLALGRAFEGHGVALGATPAALGTPTDTPADTPTGPTENTHEHLSSALTAGHDDALALELGGLARLRLLSGGTLGERAAFFASVAFGGHAPVELERASVVLTPLEPASLQIEVGAIEPELHGISLHRNLLGHQLRLTTLRVADNAFAPEPSVLALQVSGVVFGRLGLTAAAVRNPAPVTGLEPDASARVEYKLGGMRLDGEAAAAESAPWRERSVLLGLSGYRGRADIGGVREDTFWRAGADAHVTFDDLSVSVVAARQQHEHPATGDAEGRTLDLLYSEVTYVVLPWLLPTARFEWARLEAPDDPAPSQIGLVALTALVRPNLLLRVEGAVGSAEGEHFDFRFATLNLGAAL
jgi:hypothetical protein